MTKYIIVAEEINGDGTYAGGEVTNWVIESDTVLSDSEVKDKSLSSFRQRHHVEEEWMCSSYEQCSSRGYLSFLIAFTQPSESRYHSTFYRIKIAEMT